jgi:hypothetical protein
MKRARVRLVLVAGVIGGLAVMAQIGQERRPATPTAQEVFSPPTPLLEERGESATITPLEADVAALVGVRGVGVVISTGGTVYMEIDVLEGYAAQPFAEALLDVARRYGEVIDFSAVLHDGVRVPTSFVWRDGAWNGVQMIQQATLISATQPPIPTMLPALPVSTRAMAPGNCTTAVAMQLSAVEAAQYGNLDRDNDGVACYGN